MSLDMKPVQSGICDEIGYDEETQELYMLHQNGSTSVFSKVPQNVAYGVIGASSIGKAYHAMIKGRPEYPHRYL